MSMTEGKAPHMAALFAAFAFLSVSLVQSYGIFKDTSLVLALLAFGVVLWAFLTKISSKEIEAETIVLAIVGMQLTVLSMPPLTYIQKQSWLTEYRAIALAAVLLASSYLISQYQRPLWLRTRFLILVLLSVTIRVSVPMLSPAPMEDVWSVSQEAAQAVLSGQDPYQIGYTQIFSKEFYDYLGYVSGFHYTPLLLLPTVPAFALTGDIRWAFVVSELLILLMIWSLLKKSRTTQSVRELLFIAWGLNPSVMLVIEHGWSEPFLIALICGYAFFSRRGQSVIAALMITAAFSYKQYLFLLFPLLLLLPGGSLNILMFVGLNAVLYAPWLVTGRIEGLLANLLAPLRSPPRPDALSLWALWLHTQKFSFPAWLNPLVLVSGLHFAIWHKGRTLSTGVGLIGLVMYGFFLTAKQAFCNYYYFISFILLLTLILQIRESEFDPSLQ